MTVIVKDYDKPAGSTRLDIYGKVKTRSADELELAKQVLTALLSALTMMIGFYFGGRSTNDAATAVGLAVQQAVNPPNNGPPSSPLGPPARGIRSPS